jgi:ABC-type Na+ efflux pump permease subunit
VGPLLVVGASSRLVPAEFWGLLLPTGIGVWALILLPFAGLSGLLATAVAGERERGTLETWLLAPVPDWPLALAKVVPFWISGLLYQAILVSVATGLTALAEEAVPLRGVLIALVLVASGLLTITALTVSVSAWAGSSAVAQQFVVLVLLLPGLDAFAIEPVSRYLFRSLDSLLLLGLAFSALGPPLAAVLILFRTVRRDRLVLQCSRAPSRPTERRQ